MFALAPYNQNPSGYFANALRRQNTLSALSGKTLSALSGKIRISARYEMTKLESAAKLLIFTVSIFLS